MSSNEKDLNAIINEIDAGLRSLSEPERCEAIEKVPSVFERSPFPIYVNAICLRLADAFSATNSSNFVRYQIVAVLDAHRVHLSKVISVDELERRVLTVTHSNDATARCVALLFIAAFARPFRDSVKVHHRVLNALDAQRGPCELNAALFATRRFLASRCAASFADAACRKLVPLVRDGAASPPRARRRVATLFCFFQDALAVEAYGALHDAVVSGASPNEAQFVAAALGSLTVLAVRSRCVAPDAHIAMLAEWARLDRRTAVRREALAGLQRAAATMPHAFGDSHVHALLALAEEGDAALRLASLCVLETLLRGQVLALCTLTDATCGILRRRMLAASGGDVLLHGVVAGAILLHLGAARGVVVEPDADALLSLLVRAFQSVSGRLTLSSTRTWLAVLRRIDSALLVYSPAAAVRVAVCLVSALRAAEFSSVRESTLAFLCGVAHRFWFVDSPGDYQQLLDDLVQLAPGDDRMLLRCGTLLLILAQRSDVREQALAAFRKLALDAASRCQYSAVTRYRLVRSAMRYAQFAIANELLEDVAAGGAARLYVSSVAYQEWFAALRCVVRGELELELLASKRGQEDADALLARLDARSWLLAAQHVRGAYQHLVALLAYGSAPAPSQTAFQLEFIRLRAAQLDAFATLVQLLAAHRRIISSLISGSNVSVGAYCEALSVRAERYLRNQLRVIVVRLRSTRDALRTLARRCYDADAATLRCVEVQATICGLVEVLLATLLTTHRVADGDERQPETPDSLHLECLLPMCAALHAKVRALRLADSPATFEARTYFATLLDAMTLTLRIPRYFFTTRRQTIMQLIVTPASSATPSSSPSLRLSAEPIAVLAAGTVLSLKLEGTIRTQRFDKRRSLSSSHTKWVADNDEPLDVDENDDDPDVDVENDVSENSAPRRCRVRVFVIHGDADAFAMLETAADAGVDGEESASSVHEKIVAVRNDYVSAAFLIALTRSGVHRVRFAIDLLDTHNDRVWHLNALDCASLNLHTAHVLVLDANASTSGAAHEHSQTQPTYSSRTTVDVTSK